MFLSAVVTLGAKTKIQILISHANKVFTAESVQFMQQTSNFHEIIAVISREFLKQLGSISCDIMGVKT